MNVLLQETYFEIYQRAFDLIVGRISGRIV